WYYPPYVGWGGYYPAYYPRYPTYGFGARYNPWTGSYTRAGAAYGPLGGVRGAAASWNPRTGTAAMARGGSNVFGSWSSTAVQRGDQWAKSARVTNNRTDTTTRVMQGSGGNTFAGRDGNVYRKSGDMWQKYENGSWNNAARPKGTAGELGARNDQAIRDQLNRDAAAR